MTPIKHQVRISWAEPEHAKSLIPLLNALHRHDVPDAPEPHRKIIAAHATRLLDSKTAHRLAIAWDQDGTAVGLAAVAVFVSISDPRPDYCNQMELKELFVLPGFRGARVGETLIAWIENEATAANACRIDWHVKQDNHLGIAFYERFGATLVKNRLSMRKLLHPKQNRR
jgi:GNAT superfamily N-acetyltransferase